MYSFEAEKARLFTDAGQRRFIAVRDKVHSLLKQAGAVRMEEAMSGTGGSSWEMMACVDRLVELGEIRELPQPECAGQHRVFVSKRNL